MKHTLLQRFQKVVERIEALPTPKKPVLLAVSKKHSADSVRSLFEAGQRCFGESYAQEAVEKMSQLSDLDVVWHFIGPIQSNKTKIIASHFDWVQSVDRLKILQRLDRQRPADSQPIQLLLQLKVGNEDSKSGASVEDILIMYEAAKCLSHVEVRGLMCIPPPSQDFHQQCRYFDEAFQLFQKINKTDAKFDVLSMGMSADMEAAAASGSTMVRIGTDIFGARV
ncbi:YggS family pyridoxal phosphate-dependent enzyme [Marinicella rhabdoformis]|uniref:YggS family pyridoxal phosphate-dependent enzyme n=1 Tax=Marinicella rhabdoformis TaxID=2580566 RepID=UPI0012AECA0E|nr:YggS family pyridoxal phosphate-dependent enzyme [Marinicella rhabdoformis]